MANTDFRVKVSADTRWAVAWIKSMRWAAYVIGPSRAMRLASWGAAHLIRYRLGDGPWRWLRAEQ